MSSTNYIKYIPIRLNILKELFSIFYPCEIHLEGTRIKIKYNTRIESEYMKSILNGLTLYRNIDDFENDKKRTYTIEYYSDVKKIIVRSEQDASFVLQSALYYGPCYLKHVKNGYLIVFDELDAAESFMERGDGKWVENDF